MRATTADLTQYYVQELQLQGKVLEIGGREIEMSAKNIFAPPRFQLYNLDIEPSNVPSTIVADITNCQQTIADESFDVVFSSDVFEHLDRPWLAAEEIARILKPGGIAITITLWAWRNHPVPIDYWRFSPACLQFLFAKLQTIEMGYDISNRRINMCGFWDNGMDSVPVDSYGGWLENWAVYHIGGKNVADKRFPTPYKRSHRPLAKFLRADTQGRITNPELLNATWYRRAKNLLKRANRKILTKLDLI